MLPIETLKAFDEQEFQHSREYLKHALAPVIGAELLEDSRDGKWLMNPATLATYNTYLVGQPDPGLGMVSIMLDRKTADPAYGRAGATWMVLHDPFMNKVWLIPWVEFYMCVRGITGGTQHQTLMMHVCTYADTIEVMLSTDWAADIRLASLVVELSKGEFLRWREYCGYPPYFRPKEGSALNEVAPQTPPEGQPGVAITGRGATVDTQVSDSLQSDLDRIHHSVGVEAIMVEDLNQKCGLGDGGPGRGLSKTIIATNETGWTNLCKLMAAADRDHRAGVPRIDEKMLLANSEGLDVLSGFCGRAAPASLHIDVPFPPL